MIVTGTFMAKGASPINWIKASTGTMGAEVLVRFTDGPNKDQTLTWVGWLGDKSLARTEESLGLMGYDGDDDASVMRTEFSAVVELEEYEKTDGTKASRPRIKWINDPARASRFEPMAAAEVSGVKARLKAAALAAKKTTAPANPEDEPKF